MWRRSRLFLDVMRQRECTQHGCCPDGASLLYQIALTLYVGLFLLNALFVLLTYYVVDSAKKILYTGHSVL